MPTAASFFLLGLFVPSMALEAHLEVSVNSTATFTFSVTNGEDSPVELTFRSGKVADVAVTESGEEVWRWSDGRMFTQALQTRTLDSGETVEQEFVWEDPPAGEYEAVATLASEPGAEADATFTVS